MRRPISTCSGTVFFDFTRPESFPERLKDALGMRVFYAREDRPLEHFDRSGFSNGKEKILIYESTERYIPHRFTEPHPVSHEPDERSAIRKSVAMAKDHVLGRDLDTYFRLFLQRNYLTTDLFSMAATLKFDLFEYISEITPEYSLDQEIPWLFYHDQLNDENTSFYYQHSEEEIETYCDNIVDLSVKLKKLYNLKLVFMGIPTKYTIYHTVLNDDPYNNFIPRLYEELKERGIPVISLYEDYMNSDDLLFFGTDSHWTEAGLSIAIDNAVEIINQIN